MENRPEITQQLNELQQEVDIKSLFLPKHLEERLTESLKKGQVVSGSSTGHADYVRHSDEN